MESLTTINTTRLFSPKPISSLPFNSLKPFSIRTKIVSPKFKICSIKASHSSNTPNPNHTHNHISSQTLFNPNSLLKTSYIAAVTLSALLVARFINKPLPVFAATTVQSTVEKQEEELATKNAVSEEVERKLEDDYNADSGNVQAIKLLMECKVKNRKVDQAIELLNKLIEIQPDELEWILLKAHLYNSNGDAKSAKLVFEEALAKYPLCVEAYHGVVMAISENETDAGAESMDKELTELLKRIESAMEKCNEDEKREDLRDFKLLVSQIKVMEGNFAEALEVYKELVIDEPKDFRPYLCQAIVYSLLKQEDKAEEQFQKYRSLVPKDHPYAQYFTTDEIVPSNVLAQKGGK